MLSEEKLFRIFCEKKAFTLLEVMIAVAIILVLAVIAVPAYKVARIKAHSSSCINNLRIISAAYEQYYLEEASEPSSLPELASEYISHIPKCPALGTYRLPPISPEVTCSIGTSISASYPHDLSP